MWQRPIFIFALCACTAVWCAPSDASLEQKLTQLEKELDQAAVSGDAAAVERIESPDIISTAPDGAITNKTQDIEDIRSHKLTAAAVALDDLKVRIYGRTAVLCGRIVFKGAKYGGMDISGAYRFTDAWVQSNGEWHVVAWQGTAIQRH
jgi:ketosteroid isomerase-like protein